MSEAKQEGAIALWKRALTHTELEDPESLRWARSVGPHTWVKMSSEEFVRCYCFVVYASGMKYKTVQDLFPELRRAYKNFDLAELRKMSSIKAPMKIFALERKARNFLDGVHSIADEGFEKFKERVSRRGVDALERLPGIGPVTKKHLAKNIGLADIIKDDRWLVKAAKITGWQYPEDMVEFLATHTGETQHVIDIVIWNLAKDGQL